MLYAVDEASPFHDRARPWLERALNGPRRIGLPWTSPTAFVRIVTNPRALTDPLGPAEAWSHVEAARPSRVAARIGRERRTARPTCGRSAGEGAGRR